MKHAWALEIPKKGVAVPLNLLCLGFLGSTGSLLLPVALASITAWIPQGHRGAKTYQVMIGITFKPLHSTLHP